MTSDPRDDLERSLLRAAHRRQRPWWKTRSTLLGAVVVVAVAAPATAAINGVWSPEPTLPAPSTTEISASGGCSTTETPRPRVSTAPLPGYLTRAYSVLRTPRQDDDVPRLSSDLISDGAVLDAARLLGRNDDGRPYYVVPVVSRNRADLVPNDCLDQLSPSKRVAAEAANARIRSSSPTWKICVFSPRGGSCDLARRVARDGTAGQQGVSDTEPIGEMIYLVPDVVSRIRVAYAGSPPRTFTARRNLVLYRVRVQGTDGRIVGAPTVTWLDANGRAIRTIAP